MKTKSTPLVSQILLFLGCGYICSISDCLEVRAVYGETNAEFTCVISPYTFSQVWYVDLVAVADCGAISCSENASNPARFSFTPNINSGIFKFKIDPIDSTDENRIIACFDGTVTKKITFSTVRSDPTPNPKCDIICIIIIIFPCIAGILILYFCCMGILWCCYRKQMKTRKVSKCHLFIPIYGLIVFCRRICKKGILRIKIMRASAEGYFVIQWTVTDFPNENDELEYLLEYYMENKEDTTKQCIILKETQFVFENLRPETPYKIRVYAIYQSKVIESPDEISFGTEKLQQIGHRSEADLSLSKHDPVSENPNINVTKKKSAINEPSSTCYDIEWTVENFDESRSKELRYMLECILEDDENISKERIIHSEKSFKFERLLPDKTYSIRVYAIEQSKVLEPPGKYQFRTQPMKSQPLAPIDRSKRNVQ